MVEQHLQQTGPLSLRCVADLLLQLVLAKTRHQVGNVEENVRAKVEQLVDDECAYGGEPHRTEAIEPMNP